MRAIELNVVENRRGALALMLLTFLLPVLALTAVIASAGATARAVPVVDLNGEAMGSGYATTFTENAGAQAIVDPANLRITDADSATLASAKAVLTNHPDGALESLSANPGLTGLTVKFNTDTGELSVKGAASLASYEQVLRTLTYQNTSESPDIADRFVLVIVNDGAVNSAPVTSTVAINAVNDAPILDASGNMVLTSISEGDVNSVGDKVAGIIASAETGGQDRITDVDKDAQEGIAVIEAGATNGAWQYSITAGAVWIDFAGVSNSSAVLLNKDARIRFVPAPQYTGSAGITFRAWDETQGNNGSTGVDTTANGGTSAFSLASETALITVLAVDDVPQVDLNGPAEGRDFSTSFLKGGSAVAVAGPEATVSDLDDQYLTEAVFTLTNRPDGASELLAADALTTSLTIVPYNKATGQLKLVGPDTPANFQKVLRTVTYQNTAASLTLQPRVVQITVSDDYSSSPIATSTINVFQGNTAPVLDPSGPFALGDMDEDAPSPSGDTVAAMLAGAGDPITDPDPGAVEGIAVVGLDTAHGAWQYSLTDPGADTLVWQTFGTVSEGAATLLAPNVSLRFLPLADYNGPSGPLTFRAWDQTTGANGQSGVNTSPNGGASAFSTAAADVSLTVQPANDAPVISYTAPALAFVEDGPPLPLFDGSLSISDVDSETLASASLKLSNPQDGAAEWLLVETGASGLVASQAGGVLNLTGQAAPAVYEAVLRTVKYRNTSQDPTPGARALELTVSDGQSAGGPLPFSLSVQAVNDAPGVDLNGAVGGSNYATDFFLKWGPVRIADHNLAVTDVDDTILYGATVRITNPLNKPGEFLDADIYGAINVSKSYDPSTGVLTLSGQDSLANYQSILRSVTYDNILPDPNKQDRLIEVTVSDGKDDSPPAASIIRFKPTPTAKIYMAMVGRRSEEPNDACDEAFDLAPNRTEQFLPDDVHDWFVFETTAAGDITIELRDFAPSAGQLIVASGRQCSQLTFEGSNGADGTDKQLALGRQPAGRYYIWIINDGAPTSSASYRLRATVTP